MGKIATGLAVPQNSRKPETTIKPMSDRGVSMMFEAWKHPAQSVEIDYARYQKLLDDPTMSEADKRILIDAIWAIMGGFVQLGFGIHPVQQAQEAAAERQSLKDAFTEASCGQVASSDSDKPDTDISSPIEDSAKGGPA